MMRTSRTAALLALLALTVSGCNTVFSTTGSGTVITETRPVSGFDEIAVSGSGELIVEVGTTDSLTIEAEDNLLPLLTSDVSGSRLELGVQFGRGISPTKPIIYRLTVDNLVAIDIAGSASVDVSGLVGERFDLEISGSGSLTAEGTADELAVGISGSGSYDGTALEVRSADVSISGSGDAVVNATDGLNVQISGSGEVEYIGSPSISQSISGSGTVSAR